MSAIIAMTSFKMPQFFSASPVVFSNNEKLCCTNVVRASSFAKAAESRSADNSKHPEIELL